MKLIVTYDHDDCVFNWKLWDGLDGYIEKSGIELDLGQVFEEVVKQRTLIAVDFTKYTRQEDYE